jgi:peptidoglycan/LPS O-acetylase OafA/YrhL
MALVGNPLMGDMLASRITRFRRWLLPLSLATLLFDTLWHNAGFRETIRYTMDGLCLVSCFSFAIMCTNNWVFRLLNWRPVAFLGRISYGFYLTHHIVIEAVGKLFAMPLYVRIPLSLSIALAAAVMMHYFVERPVAGLRSALAQRRGARMGSGALGDSDRTIHAEA